MSGSAGLAVGTGIRLGASVRRFAEGRLLFGGSPTRLLRIRPAAAEILGATGEFTISDKVTAALADSLLGLGLAEITSVPEPVSLDQLTVVVPVHDSPEALRRLLTGLVDVRVVVVDDASPDALAHARVAKEFDATLIRLDTNSGPAAARNTGLRAVTTPFVAFCDADTVPHGDDLQRLLTHFADTRVAAVAPRILGLEGPRANWITRYENAHSSLDLGPTSAVVQPLSRVGWVPAACLLARVDALGPGFDESMRVGEDVDLIWRLTNTGALVRYIADVTIRHEHRRTPLPWLTRKYLYGTSAAPLATRHGEQVAPAALPPALALSAAALLLQTRWATLLSATAFLTHAKHIHTRLRKVQAPPHLEAELITRAATDTLRQTATLLLRHWLPLPLLLLPLSRRARRATAAALLIDTITEYRTHHPPGHIAPHLLAHRLDDTAYALGVWHSALHHRTPKPLLPHMIRTKPKPRQP
ncbi:mycofactocin biosynthesis glycosyltransferase MftF [Nocardia macrotermitis]|uniref:Putative mycofactocin biosynthesis glycosyltransferase MftF n=1 Tax=Nocardia macrotermitis TaxID=2585198 RepID=A0A7K0D9T5_9NOCA|nr:mycofactocin biosynthesis glycosyltransferase MftF [Nocardia macrotermitis]MQY22533.1 putative mycofactocin biosynthesis glycosyltransferase MftF [Nocardia macrotermitis]